MDGVVPCLSTDGGFQFIELVGDVDDDIAQPTTWYSFSFSIVMLVEMLLRVWVPSSVYLVPCLVL